MGMNPATAPWADRRDLIALAATLEARFVGGAVRDSLLGHAVADIDLATPLSPETVIARVRDSGFKPVPTGIAHGTITAVRSRRCGATYRPMAATPWSPLPMIGARMRRGATSR